MHCVYFPPEVGGLESHVFHLCRALVRKGHEVRVVTSRSRPEAPARERMDGIEVRRTWFPARNPLGWSAHALGSLPATRAIARDADVVHAQAFASVVPCDLARRGRGVPLVTTFHTSHFLRRAERSLWRPVLARLVRTADHNLAASREIADVAEALAPGTRVEALTNGVETEIFRPVEPALPAPEGGGPRIVVPRRLFEKNGVEYAVRALPRILARRPGAEMVLIGDGPERARLEALVDALGVRGSLRFLGARPHDEMPALLSSGDLAVFPSLMEATSVAALECMACGVPVAASRVGGLPEIVDDRVGALFRPADPDDLADTVLGLLEENDADGGGTLAERGRTARTRVVERWSNDRLAERHLEIYEALRAGRSPGAPASASGGSGTSAPSGPGASAPPDDDMAPTEPDPSQASTRGEEGAAAR